MKPTPKESNEREPVSKKKQRPEPRGVKVTALFSDREVERMDRTAARLGWNRARLVAECVALVLGSPGDGAVRVDELQNPQLPGMEKPVEEPASAIIEGGPL